MASHAAPPIVRLSWALLVVVTACSGGEYSVVVRFDPPSLADETRRVEVSLVRDCASQSDTGEPAVSALSTLELRRDSTRGTLAPVEPGSYGLYARAWSADCRVIAAGCDTVELEAGGSGELIVTVRPVGGPGCGTGLTCDDGSCVGPDAGRDAAVDASRDAGPACVCAACAVCRSDGTCAPDHDSCGPGTYCDPTAGCVPGTECAGDGSECPDDGDVCTTERCDTTRDPPLCVRDPTPDGSACTTAGVSGQCRLGACCGGCWNGAACEAGDAVVACGTAGGDCASCADANPCTADQCDLGGVCANRPDDAASCPGGTCRGGACCTGCWDGTSCVAGDLDSACGAGGAACAACSPMAGCPPTFCSGGACAALGAIAIGIRDNSACAIAGDGSLWCWGDNPTGGLGLGDTTRRHAPTRVGRAGWTAIDHGGEHACGIQSDGSLWCWGENNEGEVGDGTTTDRRAPVRVGMDTTWTSVDAAFDHSCAIQAPGTLWCWGQGLTGVLGDGTRGVRTSPVRVGTEGDWRSVSARTAHTCGIRAAGTLWCWGTNQDGALGIGTAGGVYDTPQRVGTDSDWARVSAAGSLEPGTVGFTCAIKTDGSLWCWGDNSNAQLGLGGPGGDRAMPVRVGTDADWALVSGGYAHACAIKMDGSLWCWGRNNSGQIAPGGGTIDRPTRIGMGSSWTIVAAGFEQTCAIATDRTTWCWGDDGEGQLGDGPGDSSGAAPVQVCL